MRFDRGMLVGASIPVLTLSTAYLAYVLFRISPIEAAIFALVTAILLYLLYLGSGLRDGLHLLRQETGSLEARLSGVARSLSELETDVIKLAEIVGSAPAAPADLEAQAKLLPDMQVMATLLRDLAAAVNVHDKALGEVNTKITLLRRAGEPAAPAWSLRELEPPRWAAEARRSEFPDGPGSGELRLGGLSASERLYPRVAAPPELPSAAKSADPAPAAAGGLTPALRILTEAVESGRLDLFLQPVVTLPQRKTAIYEATLRPSQAAGAELTVHEIRAAAAEAGIAAALDLNLLRRAERVLSGFSGRGRETQMIAPVSLAGLGDREVANFLRDLGQRDPKLAGNLIIGVPQSVQHAAGPLEAEAMALIAGSGLRLALIDANDLKLDLNTLAAQGFKYVRLSASRLLQAGQGAQHGLEIHTADIARLLQRFGIQLIADSVSSETTILDLLDYQVPLAQGDLFAAARQVRPEALAEPAVTPASKPAPARALPARPAEPAPAAEGQQRVSFRSLLRRAAG